MMGRTFAYCRVSTIEQTTENQILAIRNAGYEIIDSRVISETVSGSTKSSDRKQFKSLLSHKLEKGDTLVVLKLDRLGRDNIDVQQTIQILCDMQVQIVCLDLPVSNLNSSEGKLMLQIFSAFAEFERNRIRERTQEGLTRAKAEGKKLGRPKAIHTTKLVQKCKLDGMSQSKSADCLNISIATAKRHWHLSA